MANSETGHGAPIPYKPIEEVNDHLIEKQKPPQEHEALIASLPLHPFVIAPLPLRLYRGFWISESLLPGVLTILQHFKSQPSDIFLASFPKSGTTWLKALIFATMTRSNYPLDQHPLLTHNPHQCIPYMETQFAIGRGPIVEAIPSPRMLNTHLPYSILPDSITNSDCLIVYVWRDPKDVLVSLWHFLVKIFEGYDKVTTFDQLFEFFCQGLGPFCPIWNHVLGYWEESKRRPEKVLFLKYEDMLQEPVKYAVKLADFMGRPYSEAEERQGVVAQIVELCSFQKMIGLDVNKSGKRPAYDWSISNSSFYRRGEAGDWQNHMTEEMAKRIDAITEEKLKGSGSGLQI